MISVRFRMLSRFQGCLVGAVTGDCLGSPWEGSMGCADNKALSEYFADVKEGKVSRHVGASQISYTDDTAMARSVAESLIKNQGLNSKDLAFRFQEEYFKEPNRGYGGGVITVFEMFKAHFEKGNDFNEFAFAKEQFGGSGSYGNGGAMRIAPAGLFTYGRMDNEMEYLVRRATELTHANATGVLGAILQCLAVRQALDEPEDFDKLSFVDRLIAKMSALEGVDPTICEGQSGPQTYTDKLQVIKSYLQCDQRPSSQDVVGRLGNYISAIGSVPTAIYAFLRSTHPVEDMELLTSPFERTIGYAISLGGDTDTIASMAGAIAGAHLGVECIPKEWVSVCEGVDYAMRQATDLYQMTSPQGTN